VIVRYCGDGVNNQLVEECGFDETCEYGDLTVPVEERAQCVPCGDAGRRLSFHQEDGAILKDCVGCDCSHWRIFNCYAADVGGYEQPWVHLAWQIGSNGMVFYIGADGTVLYNPHSSDCIAGIPCDAVLVVDVIEADVRLGGSVELDITVNATYTDNFNVQHDWLVRGHVVHTCL
jgi:hypothetical protein